MMETATYWIEKLGLMPHPEGGFFREVHRSSEELAATSLAPRFTGDRRYFTSIYFLIKSGYPSHFHRIKSDEIWYFHIGMPVDLHLIDASGTYSLRRLGDTQAPGLDCFQLCIPAETLFAAELRDPNAYALVSCGVAPGFDFQDFELANAESLQQLCPSQSALIERLSYD